MKTIFTLLLSLTFGLQVVQITKDINYQTMVCDHSSQLAAKKYCHTHNQA